MEEPQQMVEIVARVPVNVRDLIEKQRQREELESGRKMDFADAAGDTLSCLTYVYEAEQQAARRGETREQDRQLSRPFASIQAEVGVWQVTTFKAPDGMRADDPLFIMAMRKHLKKEVDELELALTSHHYRPEPEVTEEMADVQILLLGMAARLGVNLEEATLRKLEINRRRKWSNPPPGEPARHINPPSCSGNGACASECPGHPATEVKGA